MRTKARVIATNGKRATVLCSRTSACEGCHKQSEGDCSVCSLMGGNKTMQAEAYNAIGARVGETVEIETASSRVLGYAALVFLLPVVALILGYLVSGLWTQEDAWRYVFALILLVLTFVGIRIYSKQREGKMPDIIIVAVVDNETADTDKE